MLKVSDLLSPRTGTEGRGQQWPPAQAPKKPGLGAIPDQSEMLQGRAQFQSPLSIHVPTPLHPFRMPLQ